MLQDVRVSNYVYCSQPREERLLLSTINRQPFWRETDTRRCSACPRIGNGMPSGRTDIDRLVRTIPTRCFFCGGGESGEIKIAGHGGTRVLFFFFFFTRKLNSRSIFRTPRVKLETFYRGAKIEADARKCTRRLRHGREFTDGTHVGSRCRVFFYVDDEPNQSSARTTIRNRGKSVIFIRHRPPCSVQRKRTCPRAARSVSAII